MAQTVAAPTQRILSIDVLRGLTVAFMILVNDPGDGKVSYWPLEHADWNGWTPTDLVFPTFLFLVGCSIVFSLTSRIKRGVPKTTLALQIVKRTLLILLINYGMRYLPPVRGYANAYHHMRWYGVLPRIALCYFAGAMLFLATRKVRNLAIVCATLLIGYYILIRFVPIPGVGMPGRDVPFMDEYNNLAAYIDRGFVNWLQTHLQTGSLYNKVRDPEGWLSTIPAIGTVILGMLTGTLIRSELAATKVRNILFGAGVAGIVSGYIWNVFFPINKNMWTSSFVLLAAGIACVLLSLTYWIFDVAQLQKTSKATRVLSWPWLVFGSNAIVAYVTPSIYGKIQGFFPIQDGDRQINALRWLYKYGFAHWGSTANTSLAYSLCFVALCFIPAFILWRRGLFLRV
jgi:predicted acyltransferase